MPAPGDTGSSWVTEGALGPGRAGPTPAPSQPGVQEAWGSSHFLRRGGHAARCSGRDRAPLSSVSSTTRPLTSKIPGFPVMVTVTTPHVQRL